MAGVTPYYEHAGITIYHGDCRDVFDEWEGLRIHAFDLLLTDPPYGHGEKWSGGTWASHPMYTDARRWDRKLPSSHLLEWVNLCEHAIIWGGNYYRLPPNRCWLAWMKTTPMATLADFELAWTNFDRPAKCRWENRNSDGPRWHPTQKPEGLMRWCLRFVPDARSLIDPFLGSGSSLVAAKAMGLRAVGIDIEERYCEIAAQRLAQEVLPLELGA